MGDIEILPSGSGSGLLGLPGDFTPVSRFIRAAFFLSYSRTPATAYDAMSLSFTILSNFNIPLSGELPAHSAPQMPAATQWTSVIDATGRALYYRTMYNSTIRRIEIDKIDFEKEKERYVPLDKTLHETITDVSL
jgi:choloylglycine hydrolase